MKPIAFIIIYLLSAMFFIATIFPIQAIGATSPDNLWKDIPLPETAARGVAANTKYRLVEADISALQNILEGARPEMGAGPETIITIPLPDGKFQRFIVEESPIMEPALAARFPNIRTYLGIGLEDPSASARFDLTPKGFHAILTSHGKTVYLDPDSPAQVAGRMVNIYRSYFRYDFRPDKPKKLECETEEHLPSSELAFRPFAAERPLGEQLRTYRIAIAATGEYTQFHGGTVEDGLAAVITTLNRVNFIYERDVSVRLVLVANNDQIIYTDPNTDPYTNNSGKTMLDENQTNLDFVIGSANYDIGHVFSTGGGGIATVGVVCDTNKARGVTGSSSPVGDPFDIDFVAHEIGHQFNANHTFNADFNGDSGFCYTRGHTETAYEPGSGSTIMSYAGICGSQNLQPHADDYFHVASIDEITDFVTMGVGNSCAVITDTLNSPPVVDAGQNYTIPMETPFTLTGLATDPDGDALTFVWEEFDLGPAGDLNFPSGDAPIFRSFPPTNDPSRTFPRVIDLINGTPTLGELLPTYGRTLTFRFTVRDNRAGGGGLDYDTVTLTVDDTTGPFSVLSPNTNVTLTGNSTKSVTWDVAGTDRAPVNCTQVDILLSINGGQTFSWSLALATPNDGEESVTIPNIPTTRARLKVACSNNVFFDISDTDFIITNAPSDLIFSDGFEDDLIFADGFEL